jgi:acyl-CoA thioester hydrolase
MTANPFSVRIPVRYRDRDTMGHVNNAVYVTYLEEARVAYFEDLLPSYDYDDAPFVIANIDVSFERSIRAVDHIAVEVSLDEIGRTSLTLTYRLSAAGDLAATAETVQVFVDPDTREPVSIPDELRERLDAAAP